MKKLLMALLVVAVALSIGLGSCAKVKPKVAGVVFQEDQFMKLLQLGYKDTAIKAGYDFYPGNTNGDAAKEAEFLNTYVTQKYKGARASTSGCTRSPTRRARGSWSSSPSSR